VEELEVTRDKILKKYGFKSPLGTAIIGAIGEYLVIADLLEKGYEVFYAATRTSSCDLVILNNGLLRRVEVKVNQQAVFPRADILALVTSEGIIYQPDLPDIKVKPHWHNSREP